MTTAVIPNRRVRPKKVAPAATAVGYLRVSTADQADSGLGLAAQREAIQNYADAHGLTVISWHEDVAVSGKVAPERRPGMSTALEALNGGDAAILIAAKLDRVSRSMRDATTLVEVADKRGWSLRTTDGTVGGDDSPMGRAMVGMAATFAELERGLIGMRTREALAELKAQGKQLGTPTKLPDEVITRIILAMDDGQSLRAIAGDLMADGITTGSGSATWRPVQVKRAVESQRGQKLICALFPEGNAA